MSAELLKEAAAKMRERAEGAATDLRHKPTDPGVWRGIGTGYREPIKDHIASWHPAVALTVAEWLEEAADHLAVEDGDDDGLGHICPTALEGLECSVLGQALNVARAYLGGDA